MAEHFVISDKAAETLRGELKTLDQEKNNLSNEITQLKTYRDYLDGEVDGISNLKERILGTVTTSLELADLDRAVEELGVQKNHLEHTCLGLSKHVNHIDRCLDDRVSVDKQLEGILGKKAAELQDLDESLQRRREFLNGLEESIKESRTELEELSGLCLLKVSELEKIGDVTCDEDAGMDGGMQWDSHSISEKSDSDTPPPVSPIKPPLSRIPRARKGHRND